MTKWVLQCMVCGEKRTLDVGFDLSEFKQLHVYCKSCRATRPHRVLGVSDETISL
ncbi:MAG: hypothetical protein QXL98_01215 [Thermofilaceae archaeon]